MTAIILLLILTLDEVDRVSFTRATILSLFVLLQPNVALSKSTSPLFGYSEVKQSDMSILSQWISVMERHIKEDVPEGSCESREFNKCHLRKWNRFLQSIKNKPRREQLQLVNDYANNKEYILDIDNYNKEDYWAIVKEFLYNGGDCEDFSIIKLYSLRWLGFNIDSTRLVILQDTNLRIAHAVLAVYIGNDILILDNQTDQVTSHKEIVHYTPLFSVNEKRWWMHLP